MWWSQNLAHSASLRWHPRRFCRRQELPVIINNTILWSAQMQAKTININITQKLFYTSAILWIVWLLWVQICQNSHKNGIKSSCNIKYLLISWQWLHTELAPPDQMAFGNIFMLIANCTSDDIMMDCKTLSHSLNFWSHLQMICFG